MEKFFTVKRGFLSETYCNLMKEVPSGRKSCEDWLIGLPSWEYDHPGSGFHLFLGFPYLNYEMPPERIWSEPELVGSEEILLVVIRSTKSDIPSD